MSFRRSQSRAGSLAEAATNVAAGFLLALLAQQAVFPVFGIATTLPEDAGIAAIFTALSLLRSYLLRRLFEGIGAGRSRASRLTPGRPYRLVEDS
jgi:hypothetical protein